MTYAASPAHTRSAFVTALAWVFIALAGFSTLIAILQNILFNLVVPAEELRAAIRESENTQPLPASVRFLFENVRYLFAGFLVLSASTLIAAIGLLKRRNWARLMFIAMLALGVVWELASLAMLFMMNSMIPEMPAQLEAHDRFKVMWNIMIAFTAVFCLAFAVLFAWIIKRLLSDEIKSEFVTL